MSDAQREQNRRDDFRRSPDYVAERLKVAFAVEIEQAMERIGVRSKDLAARLGTSAAYVSKLLSGDANCTIETMAKVAHALNAQTHISIGQKGRAIWFIEPTNASRAAFKQSTTLDRTIQQATTVGSDGQPSAAPRVYLGAVNELKREHHVA